MNLKLLPIPVNTRINTPRKQGGLGPMKIPLLSDLTHQISKDYGVYLEDQGHTLRCSFMFTLTTIVKHHQLQDTCPPLLPLWGALGVNRVISCRSGMGDISVSDLWCVYTVKACASNKPLEVDRIVLSLRGLFIIDDRGILRQITMNDLPVGRSVDETLRLVQAFQYTDKHGEGTRSSFNVQS